MCTCACVCSATYESPCVRVHVFAAPPTGHRVYACVCLQRHLRVTVCTRACVCSATYGSPCVRVRVFAAPPTVTVSPPASMNVGVGGRFEVSCEAVGTPTPLIIWRLNWGHIGTPPRVSTRSEGGRGVITISTVRKEDEGAYTCEAHNNKGSIFAQPDTILIVTRERTSALRFC